MLQRRVSRSKGNDDGGNLLLWRVVIFACLASTLVACGAKPDSCAFWIEELQSDKVEKALREIGEKKCTAAIGEMEKLFDTGQYTDRIMQSVKQMNNPALTKKLVIKALGDAQSGAIAAYLVREWKLSEATPMLKKVIQNDKVPPFVKGANLKALLSFGKQPQEMFLIELLKTNPERQGLVLNRIAAETLGEIKSSAAVPYLINALYYSSGKQNIYGEASLSLARIGKAAAPWLKQSIEGTNPHLLSFAKEYRVNKWVIDLKLAALARDLRIASLGPHLYKYMTSTIEIPLDMPQTLQTLVKQVWESTLAAGAMGLAYLKATPYSDRLKEDIKDNEIGKTIRRRAAMALAYLDGPRSIPFFAELIRSLRQKDPKKDVPFRALRGEYFNVAAKVADAAGVESLRKLVEEEKDNEVKRVYLEWEILLESSEQCKADVACWRKLLYFDLVGTRNACAAKPAGCKFTLLKPQQKKLTARKEFLDRAEKCGDNRECWTKVFTDVIGNAEFKRLKRKYKKRVLAKLKRSKAPIGKGAQKMLTKWITSLPIQPPMPKRVADVMQGAVREKAAVMLGFSKSRDDAVAALRSFLQNRDVITRDTVLFGLERQLDVQGVTQLKAAIEKEKGKSKFAYIGDRMQLLVFRLERGDTNGTATFPPLPDKPKPKKRKKRKKT